MEVIDYAPCLLTGGKQQGEKANVDAKPLAASLSVAQQGLIQAPWPSRPVWSYVRWLTHPFSGRSLLQQPGEEQQATRARPVFSFHPPWAPLIKHQRYYTNYINSSGSVVGGNCVCSTRRDVAISNRPALYCAVVGLQEYICQVYTI